MTGDIGEQGTCTTCTFSEDFSNYWTAVLFFKHQNGTYKRVPIMSNDALPAGINGGMTIYYTQQDFNTNGKQFIRTFPPVSSPLSNMICVHSLCTDWSCERCMWNIHTLTGILRCDTCTDIPFHRVSA